MARVKNNLDGFQSIPRDLIFDNKLSDRARFVYCYMASKPKEWEFFHTPMAKELGYGVDTLRKYINELVASGWLTKYEQSNEKGVFGAVEYTIEAERKVIDAENHRHGNLPIRKNTDTENFRHGKIPQQKNKDFKENKDCLEIIEKKEEINKFISNKKENVYKLDLSAVSDDYMSAITTWLDYKRERKDYYKQRGFNAFYSRLRELSGGDSDKAMKIVEQSMASNYRGIFPIKGDESKKSNNLPVGFILEGDRDRIISESKKDLWK